MLFRVSFYWPLKHCKSWQQVPFPGSYQLETRSLVGTPKNPLTCLLDATWHTSLSLGPRLIRKAERQGKRGAPHQQGRQLICVGQRAIMWQKCAELVLIQEFSKATKPLCSRLNTNITLQIKVKGADRSSRHRTAVDLGEFWVGAELNICSAWHGFGFGRNRVLDYLEPNWTGTTHIV